MPQAAIAIVCKAPAPGQTKTRLIPRLGAEPLATFPPKDFGYAAHIHAILGRVVSRALALLGRGHDCVNLVNGDSPPLPPQWLADCIRALRQGEPRVVFGRAIDHLVGLNHDQPRLFEDIPRSTLAKARRIGEKVTELGVWCDVDDAESLDWPPREGAFAAADRSI